MFMRYLGGGIGHQRTTISNDMSARTAGATNLFGNTAGAAEDHDDHTNLAAGYSSDSESDDEDELVDYGYVSSEYGEDDEYEPLDDIDADDVDDEGPDNDDALFGDAGFNMY